MNFPLPSFLAVSASNPWTYLVFGLVGFAFGYTLEMSGFGDSRKLAAQFYFTELTVIKVMFTAIVVAMILIFGAVGLGILDFSQVWVNTTYLSSGILGGLIMGVGFIIGGFCPTTSLASASTGKIDGMFFVGGGFVGAFLFGETEKYFTYWYNNSGYFGRLTLMDVFKLPTGVIVLLVVLMALFMFWGSEQLERIFGKKDLTKEPKTRLYGAAGLLVMALVVVFIGSPSTESKYARVKINRTVNEQSIAMSADEALAKRQIQIVPAELFKSMNDDTLKLTVVDVRPEADYNLFHIRRSLNIPAEQLKAKIPQLLASSAPNAVYVLLSNDEDISTTAWKMLVAESVPNVYILEGGVNNWIAFFGKDDASIVRADNVTAPEKLKYIFPAALGDNYVCSDPSPIEYETLKFDARIQLQLKRDKSGGGCG
ncbi:MAG: YeeE/YedE thiosulfate transporter family protein [Chloroflexi bacterium]|nr:YeeE/YedE thiosulfate transporter family protein [Chloroflexota bacterium]